MQQNDQGQKYNKSIATLNQRVIMWRRKKNNKKSKVCVSKYHSIIQQMSVHIGGMREIGGLDLS